MQGDELRCCQSIRVGIVSQGFHIDFGLAGQCKDWSPRLQMENSIARERLVYIRCIRARTGTSTIAKRPRPKPRSTERLSDFRGSETRETAGSYQTFALVERADDPHRSSCRALSATPAMRSIVAQGSRFGQSWSWSLTWLRIDLLRKCFVMMS